MSFTLTRCVSPASPLVSHDVQLGHASTRFLDVVGAASQEPGGIFTMGYLNTSLYTGNIEYTSLVNSGTYWLIPLTSTSPSIAVTISNVSFPDPMMGAGAQR